jgi:hypothetical protein
MAFFKSYRRVISDEDLAARRSAIDEIGDVDIKFPDNVYRYAEKSLIKSLDVLETRTYMNAVDICPKEFPVELGTVKMMFAEKYRDVEYFRLLMDGNDDPSYLVLFCDSNYNRYLLCAWGSTEFTLKDIENMAFDVARRKVLCEIAFQINELVAKREAIPNCRTLKELEVFLGGKKDD